MGGDLSLSQQFGHLNSNSIFINPNNQATGQLGLEWVQPLARGGSRDVNRAGIDLARISVTSSQTVLRTEIQERLSEIVKAYWSLVLSRGKLVQMNRSVFRAEQTTQQMAQRQEIDVLPQQLIRGQAAVARRKAAAGQAKFEALKTQEVLMRLIFGDQYQAKEIFEIVPLTSQPGEIVISSLASGLIFGIQNRPEIHYAMQAQDRVQQTETDSLESIISYGISQAAWLRAIGGLDQYDQKVQVDTVID